MQHGVLMDYFELVDFSICKSVEWEYYFVLETPVFSLTHFIINILGQFILLPWLLIFGK